MFKTKSTVQSEPTTPMTSNIVEIFESAGDRERRCWAEQSGDWSFAVLQILQGSRRQEVSLAELELTKIYARSDQREADALRFVAAQVMHIRPLSETDRIILATMDNFLIQYADGETLGQRNIVEAIRGIPARVRRAQEIDRSLFPQQNQFPERVLFSWLWGAKAGHGAA